MRYLVPAAVAAAVAFAAFGGVGSAANGHANAAAVCPAQPDAAHCHALVTLDSHGNPDAQSSPYGLSPQQIRSAYNFPSSGGAGKTIAIVDAFNDPTVVNDLNVFSSTYGIPCNGCLTVVNQNGGAGLPRTNANWALEISLDVQWAHAIAPDAHILLVEAKSNRSNDLYTAENYAKAHAQYVSNSWGSAESSGESAYDSYFLQPGVSFFVSAGDNGTPAEYPSSSPNVISVGGTYLDLSRAQSDPLFETGWSSGGGGCSLYETATAAQRAFLGYVQTACGTKRATPDVSLDADPNSGVSVYDTTPYNGQSGWWRVGGTSASSPMWAGRAAVLGSLVDASYVYGNGINFRDITVGNNGAPCLVGFDLCSGRGSWIG